MSVTLALDSNVLLYAEIEPDSDKGRIARSVIARSAATGAISAQALLEVVAVVRRRLPDQLSSALSKIAAWRNVFEITPTSEIVMANAIDLVRSHHLQVWDAVIWCAARASGARILFTEDLQDGLSLIGVQAVNPFARSRDELEALLPTAP